jgi:hypothetical protein
MLFPILQNGHQLNKLSVLLVFARLLQTDLEEDQEEIETKKLHKVLGQEMSNHYQEGNKDMPINHNHKEDSEALVVKININNHEEIEVAEIEA